MMLIVTAGAQNNRIGAIQLPLAPYWYLQSIFDKSIDQLAVLCRTPLASRVGACFSNIANPQIPLTARAFNAVLVPYRLSRVIDEQIVASPYPRSLAIAKEVISCLTVEWFKDDLTKRNKLKNEIIPLVAQKFLELKIYNGLQMLFEYCEENDYLEYFKDKYTEFYVTYPNLGNILNPFSGLGSVSFS